MINANDAYLNGGIGFAQYDNAEKQKMFMNDKIRCLITTEEANLKYILAGNRGDIIKLVSGTEQTKVLGEENNADK